MEASDDGVLWRPVPSPRWARLRPRPSVGAQVLLEWELWPDWEWVLDWGLTVLRWVFKRRGRRE